MWSDFKAFLRRDLGDSQAFIDSIWSKFRRDSQYQLEEARDYASHLQHLQSILVEFDTIGAPTEPTMIYYFQKSLKPSIKIEMEQKDRSSTSFEKIVQRTVNREAKAGLKSSTMVRDLDARCPRGHRPSQNTSSKVQTQSFSHKDSPRFEKSKNKDPKPASPHGNVAEPAKKEDKKKGL